MPQRMVSVAHRVTHRCRRCGSIASVSLPLSPPRTPMAANVPDRFSHASAARRAPLRRGSRFLRRTLTHALVLAAAAAGAATVVNSPMRAQPASGSQELTRAALDSVRAALASSDWNERHAAIARINGAYPDALPATVVEPVLELLAREASANAQVAGDEAFGEYLVDLVLTAVRTGNVRAVPAVLSLDGLGMSSGVAAFVARQGPAVMSALDAFARTRDDRASDVLETYALMYARYGARLTRADSAQVLRRLMAAASDTSIVVRSQLALVAPRGPIGELLPVIADLAAADPGQIDGVYYVRSNASRAIPDLQRAQRGLTTAELLNRLTLLTDAACESAGDRLGGQCVALNAHLSTALRHLSDTNPQAATAVLGVFRRAVQRLADERVLPRVSAVTLDGAAAALVDRLGGAR